MYESLRNEINWEHNPPKGALFHEAAFDGTDNTVHVANVWESEDDLNSFVSSRLTPYMINNKIPESKVEIFQVNDVSAFAGIDNEYAKASVFSNTVNQLIDSFKITGNPLIGTNADQSINSMLPNETKSVTNPSKQQDLKNNEEEAISI